MDDWRLTWIILVFVGISSGIALGLSGRTTDHELASILPASVPKVAVVFRPKECRSPNRERPAVNRQEGDCLMTFAMCFTNFGPYHLARLRGLAALLAEEGSRLVAYEVAGREQTYPWSRSRHEEPFEWITLFPDRVVETIEPAACRRAMVGALDRDQPDAVGMVGLRASRIDGRGAVGETPRANRDSFVREPGHRSAAHMVERADQDAADAPV